jgi:hypothetical protein
LIDRDVIEQSVSPTASALVLVLQNGKWRMCVDFRNLNAITEGDCYPMLRSDYVFKAVTGKQYLSLLDALKGYNQVSLAGKDREKTAFISHRGLFQYKRLPFGLKNATAQFQRLMDVLLGSLRWVCALVYIIEIVINTDTWAKHIRALRTLLMSAEKLGVRFSLRKCKFGYNELKVLGHGVSKYGLHTLAEKVETIMELPIPRKMDELHRTNGLFAYYRRFIGYSSKIAAPLNDMKKGSSTSNYQPGVSIEDK